MYTGAYPGSSAFFYYKTLWITEKDQIKEKFKELFSP